MTLIVTLSLDSDTVTEKKLDGANGTLIDDDGTSNKRYRYDSKSENSSDTESGCEREEKRKKNNVMEANEATLGDEDRGSWNSRRSLLFPQSCKMAFMEKLQQAIELGQERRNFEPVLKAAKGKPDLTKRQSRS